MNENNGGLDYTDEELKRALKIIAFSPTKFCKKVLGFHPFPYQTKMLEDPSKNIIVCAARRTGKTVTTAMKALWFAICHPDSSTLIVAATQRQSMIMFDTLLDYVEKSKLLKGSVLRKTRTLIRFTNGSRIVALPCGRSGNTLRGETANLIIVDEAAFVPEEVILSVMMPMLATTYGTMIMLSTPYDRDHFFYRAFSAQLWSKYKFKTSDNPLVKKEYLENQLEMVGETRFQREYLAEFVEEERTYFPMRILRPCVHVCQVTEQKQDCPVCSANGKANLALLKGELYAGYDPGGLSDPAALVVVRKMPVLNLTANGQKPVPAFQVVYTKTFSAKKGSDGDVYTRFDLEIADLHKKVRFKKMLVDSTGIGNPIVSHCKELGLPVEGINLHRKNQEEIFSNLKILLEQSKVELPSDLSRKEPAEFDLLSSLNCIIAERNRTGEYSFTHPSGTRDDLAYALALAVWCANKSPVIVKMLQTTQDQKSEERSWRDGI